MYRRLFPRALGLLCMMAAPAVAKAGLVELCEVQPNIDYECKNCTPNVRELPIALFEIAAPSNATGLHQIEFSMSMQVANPSTSGLRLALDGVDTGIPLTGFQKNSLVENSYSLSEGDPNWLSPTAEAQLMDALKDGQVFASLVTDNPADLAVQLYSDTDVELCLTFETPTPQNPVPEPASVLLWSVVGLAAAARMRVRRRHTVAG